MNDPLAKKPPPPGRRASIALAVAVHVVLAIVLIYGVHWQTEPPVAVEVELVAAVPAPAAEPSPPAPAPEPPPQIEPKVEPPPAPPPPKPEIAIKEKKEKPKPPPKEEPKARFDPAAEVLKREDADAAARRAREAAAKELAEMDTSKKAAQASAARNKAIASWQGKIGESIKKNIVRPANVAGNPEAIFEITLLPDGSLVGEPRMKKSTGNAPLDAAIERAIRKSEPLPKPDDPSVFQRLLELKFRPLED